MRSSTPDPPDVAVRYLDLIRRVLTREIGGERQRPYTPIGRTAKAAAGPVQAVLARAGLEIVYATSPDQRAEGLDCRPMPRR
jgi:hypothetical protein